MITKADDRPWSVFAYEKRIPLFGPASLLIEYKGDSGRMSLRRDESLQDVAMGVMEQSLEGLQERLGYRFKTATLLARR